MTDREKALQFLSALQSYRADDYETWLKVGMALHSVGASCSDWDDWSKKSTKYKAGVCEAKWKSFKNFSGNPITVASLAQFAKEDGYVPEQKFVQQNHKAAKELSSSQELFEYLKALYKPGDRINFVRESIFRNGKYIPIGKGVCKSFDELAGALGAENFSLAIGSYKKDAGAWIRLNPVSGDGCKDSDVVEFRHCLIEADTLPKHEQLEKIKALKLPCIAIVDSGGKSIHAVIKIDAGKDENSFRQKVSELHRFLELNGFPVDKACKNPSRLSRMPGVFRGSQKQSLIEINPDALSWDKWLELNENLKLDIIGIDEILNADANDMSDSLVGKRFLCRDGSWLIVAQSGIGKSVFAMQVALHFATGRSIFELAPHIPRKVILIQAENNRLDLLEPSKSILSVMEISEDELALLRKNLFIISENKSSGTLFIKVLEKICARFAPDIVIVDPLLSYIGDDISLQSVCSSFLRNQLNPVIQKFNIGLIIMHHTGKPPKDKPVHNVADLSYLGIGSSELTNWARAVSVLVQNSDDNNVFELTHAKRGKRSGVEGRTFLMHANDGKIYWQPTVKPEKADSENTERRFKYDYLNLQNMPPLWHTEKDYNQSKVIAHIRSKLKEANKPHSLDDAKKVFLAGKRQEANILVFDKELKLWRGVLYKSEGGAA